MKSQGIRILLAILVCAVLTYAIGQKQAWAIEERSKKGSVSITFYGETETGKPGESGGSTGRVDRDRQQEPLQEETVSVLIANDPTPLGPLPKTGGGWTARAARVLLRLGASCLVAAGILGRRNFSSYAGGKTAR